MSIRVLKIVHFDTHFDSCHVLFAVQDYLVSILLETATKEHFEGARYGARDVHVLSLFVLMCFTSCLIRLKAQGI